MKQIIKAIHQKMGLEKKDLLNTNSNVNTVIIGIYETIKR